MLGGFCSANTKIELAVFSNPSHHKSLIEYVRMDSAFSDHIIQKNCTDTIYSCSMAIGHWPTLFIQNSYTLDTRRRINTNGRCGGGEPSDKAFVLHRRAPYSHPPTIAASQLTLYAANIIISASLSSPSVLQCYSRFKTFQFWRTCFEFALFTVDCSHTAIASQRLLKLSNYFHVLLKLQSVSHSKHIQLKLMN